MRKLSLPILLFTLMAASCHDNRPETDASGVFESDEVIVSAEQTGKLLSFPIKEGDTLRKGALAGSIDINNVILQKQQVEASIQALRQKTTDPRPQLEYVKRQLAVQQSQLAQQQREKARTENLLKADAATQKQLDDINSMIDQLQKQIDASRQQIVLFNSNIATQNRTVFSEKDPLEKNVATIQDQINKGQVINPITGTVLTKYALEGEMATTGKALYKIANLDTLTLRAYATGAQLTSVRLGQPVKVYTDQGAKNYKEYPGQIYWISDKSEFTPKTIQTKDERANLVYAVKIRVKNDGYLRIGMYGEVKF
ncbi:HlyD family efflux transporter periplasmic adaptor subunit [Flavitalea sp. BT771]|uniref:HlyD family secretion protein n=1 Tax=Flavitalea sp. BT771 TaxID=3063329 RepID=UPI0026E15121|nr:HlyD family efflux transporter periplasmic adaptor subunit [Flavitalea sp. BT771]MDO6429923.1 HlyD family efflux transporter periplasmic adaptor subunit [Flavitalea sp. BT771]MDV6217949.1 HlyD family efflux transporter periplasmic adaptor subunit [Flavitalea sp. BT771]